MSWERKGENDGRENVLEREKVGLWLWQDWLALGVVSGGISGGMRRRRGRGRKQEEGSRGLAHSAAPAAREQTRGAKITNLNYFIKKICKYH